jgi:hypothetical protein
MGKLGQTGTHGFRASAGIVAFGFVEQLAALVAQASCLWGQRASCPLNAVVEGGCYATPFDNRGFRRSSPLRVFGFVVVLTANVPA